MCCGGVHSTLGAARDVGTECSLEGLEGLARAQHEGGAGMEALWRINEVLKGQTIGEAVTLSCGSCLCVSVYRQQSRALHLL